MDIALYFLEDFLYITAFAVVLVGTILAIGKFVGFLAQRWAEKQIRGHATTDLGIKISQAAISLFAGVAAMCCYMIFGLIIVCVLVASLYHLRSLGLNPDMHFAWTILGSAGFLFLLFASFFGFLAYRGWRKSKLFLQSMCRHIEQLPGTE